MAEFDNLVRAGIALADSLTSSLQVAVQHSAWISSGDFGEPTFASAVSRQAIVEYRQEEISDRHGNFVVSRAKVTFLRPIAANGATGRQEPIDPRDKIVLPDGSTGPIIDTAGLADPDTSAPYMTEVYIGRGGATVS